MNMQRVIVLEGPQTNCCAVLGGSPLKCCDSIPDKILRREKKILKGKSTDDSYLPTIFGRTVLELPAVPSAGSFIADTVADTFPLGSPLAWAELGTGGFDNFLPNTSLLACG